MKKRKFVLKQDRKKDKNLAYFSWSKYRIEKEGAEITNNLDMTFSLGRDCILAGSRLVTIDDKEIKVWKDDLSQELAIDTANEKFMSGMIPPRLSSAIERNAEELVVSIITDAYYICRILLREKKFEVYTIYSQSLGYMGIYYNIEGSRGLFLWDEIFRGESLDHEYHGWIPDDNLGNIMYIYGDEHNFNETVAYDPLKEKILWRIDDFISNHISNGMIHGKSRDILYPLNRVVDAPTGEVLFSYPASLGDPRGITLSDDEEEYFVWYV